MYYFGYFIAVSLFLIQNAYTDLPAVEPKCSDLSNLNKVKCCSGYRTIGNKCHRSFGEECSKPCPEGYYGVKCLENCSCERCNATTGECFNGTGAQHNTNIAGGPKNSDTSGSMAWIPILLGLLGSMGTLAVLFLVLYIKERKTFVQCETVLDVSAKEENTNNENDQEDYDSIRESRMVLDDEVACGSQKFTTLDRVSYAKTQTLQNPYNKLSFNRLKSRTMEFRNGELYNISETGSLKMDVGDYVTVASDKDDTDRLKSKDFKGENIDEPYSNYYSDAVNIQSNKKFYCGKLKENLNVSEKKAKHRPKVQNKKPTIKPKPAHLSIGTEGTKEQKEDGAYSLADQLD